jgi:hypothetical protein
VKDIHYICHRNLQLCLQFVSIFWLVKTLPKFVQLWILSGEVLVNKQFEEKKKLHYIKW